MSEETSPWNDYHKWRRWAYEQRYGPGSWDKGARTEKEIPKGFQEYIEPFKAYWNNELSLGILERNGKFIGVACLVAKEVVDKESFVRRFGLSFEKDVQWKAAASLLDQLSRSPLFKAVLVTVNKVPSKIEPDVPEELEGRLRWAKRNYNYHKYIAQSLQQHIKAHPIAHAPHHPKQMKEEEDYARKFLQTCRDIEGEIREHMKQYFLIKENLFAAALFLYVYTHACETFQQAVDEILGRMRSTKIEANLTYFVKCTEVKDPIIVFNLAQVSQWERSIIVEFVLRKLSQLGQSKTIRAVSLFLEEVQLYVEPKNMVNILTRMRHVGIFPTFITNDPRTLPDEVFTLLDNLIAFMFRNEDELRQLAKSGIIDLKSINALKHLESRQCIAVGNITSNYPIFLEVSPQTGVIMGGETRKLVG